MKLSNGMPKPIVVRGRPIDAETPADRKNNPARYSWASRADIGSDMRISPSDSWMMSNAAMGGSTDPWAVAAADAVVADRVRKSLVESTDAGILGMPSPSAGGAGGQLGSFDFEGGNQDVVGKRFGVPADQVTTPSVFSSAYWKNSPETKDFYDTKTGQWVDRNADWAMPVGKAILATLLGSPVAGLASLAKSGYQEVLDRFQKDNKDYNPRWSAATPDWIERILASKWATYGPALVDLFTAAPTIASAIKAGR